jgi:DNA (cytosine-5)-methyltransferase 1
MANNLDGYYIKNIKQNRGAPRLWFDGNEIRQAGFSAGQKYEIKIEGKSLILQANPNGTKVVSGKKKDDKDIPIIDLNSNKLLAIFDGMASVRVVVRDQEIIIVPLASELKKVERINRLKSKLENDEPLAIGSLYHGGGIMSHALHKGLQNAGIASSMSFINEVREELVDHASVHNDAWTPNTKVFSAPVQELAFDERAMAHIPKTDIMEMGIPCNAASSAGKAKTGISMPEANEEVGHLVVGTLIILSKSNPAICLFENVPAYANTASAAILRTQLKDMGYNLHEKILNGNEFGALENRNRWVMVAVTHGIEFSLDNLIPLHSKPANFGDICEDIADDDPRWVTMQGLKDKEVRDIAAGKGFRMQIVNSESESLPTVTKGYAKIRSTDPKVQHPHNPELLRQITVREHGDGKGIPYKLLEGASNTLGHEIAGQSVIYFKIEAVGQHAGNYLNKFAGKRVDERFSSQTAISSSINQEFPDDILKMAIDIGCQLKWPKSAVTYEGRIQGVGEKYFIQDIGRNESAIFEKPSEQDSSAMAIGANVRIVRDKDKNTCQISPVKLPQMSLEI